jgi:hypothetical protein
LFTSQERKAFWIPGKKVVYTAGKIVYTPGKESIQKKTTSGIEVMLQHAQAYYDGI